jgi:hypothetical protein
VWGAGLPREDEAVNNSKEDSDCESREEQALESWRTEHRLRGRAIAFSPYYMGLMMDDVDGLRSQNEGDYWNELEASKTLTFYATSFGMIVKPAGSLDPE